MHDTTERSGRIGEGSDRVMGGDIGMALNGTPGQALVAYYAEPGTPDHDAITLLDRADADQTTDLSRS